jgi:hypothetical protein
MCFLRHKYEPRRVNHITRKWDHGGQQNITQVLLVCNKCGKMKTQDLDGLWLLNDIKFKK